MIEFLTRPFSLAMHCFGPPSRALVDYDLKSVGMVLHGAVGVNCEKGVTAA